MNRTVSSERPFGAFSDEICVSKPYLYWSLIWRPDRDGLLYSRHLTPPQRFQGPRGLLSVMVFLSGHALGVIMRRGPVFLSVDSDFVAFANIQEAVDIGSALAGPVLMRTAPAREFRCGTHGGEPCEGAPCGGAGRAGRQATPSRSKAITSVSALGRHRHQGGVGSRSALNRR